MQIRILPAENADIPRIFEISSLAFGKTEPAWCAWYQGHDNPTGRKKGTERYLQSKQCDKNAIYHKAIDTGKEDLIVGFSVWAVYDNSFLDPTIEFPSDDTWETTDDAEYAKAIFGWVLQMRSEFVKGEDGKVVHLQTLAVDPEYQRKGVGGLLMQWGLERADELGYRIFVESSKMGRGLYEKCGFVWQGDWTIPVPEKFGGRTKCVYISLVRTGKSQVAKYSILENGVAC